MNSTALHYLGALAVVVVGGLIAIAIAPKILGKVLTAQPPVRSAPRAA